MDTPRVAIKRTTWSKKEFLYRAAHMPIGIENTIMTTSAAAASCKVAGRKCMTSASTGRCDAYVRSEEQTSELQSLMRISYAVFCLIKKNNKARQNKEEL